jgi:hypothetical protein
MFHKFTTAREYEASAHGDLHCSRFRDYPNQERIAVGLAIMTRLSFEHFEAWSSLNRSHNSLWPKPHHEMGAVRLRERFAFALERDDIRTRGWNSLGWNGRLKLVLRDKARRQRLAVQHDLVEWPHAALPIRYR